MFDPLDLTPASIGGDGMQENTFWVSIHTIFPRE